MVPSHTIKKKKRERKKNKAKMVEAVGYFEVKPVDAPCYGSDWASLVAQTVSIP